MKFKKTAIIVALALSTSIPVLANADIKTDTIDERFRSISDKPSFWDHKH